jgi:sulfate/thiosulfate transport system permease protein
VSAVSQSLPRARVSRRARRPIAPIVLGVVVAVFLVTVLLMPVAAVVAGALSRGAAAYLHAITTTEALSSMRLTLLTAGSAVLLNTVFGVAAAWALTRGDFPGKSVLVTLIDLPLSVSPVISGLVFVVLFGARGVLGPWLIAHDVRILFTPTALVLATVFVTFPFVARELVGVMHAQGTEEEQAAVTLGARGWQVFFRVTLPKIKWALLYGVLLCNARAMGEFGAVSVVSGHVRGRTNTMPLHVEILYSEYDFAGAFAVASVLLLLAVVTLVVKSVVERRTERGGLLA